MKNIDKKLENELKKSLNELLDKIELASEDLELYINLNFDDGAIDEEDLIVKLYRAIGQVGYIIEYNKELCDIVYNDEE